MDTDGNIIEKKVSSQSDYLNGAIINSVALNFFKSMDSQLAEVGTVRYPRFNKEAQMVEQGFENDMFQGLDEAYRMSYFADHLRKSNIHPYKTHIADFSDQIPERIRFIREGITGDGEKTKVAERLEILDKMALEALKKQQEKGVTYAWWLKWNKKLMSLLDVENFNQLYVANDPDIGFLIQAFPDFVALPTVEDIRAMAINKSISENVLLLGLFNRPTYADGQTFMPHNFLTHDMGHARNILNRHIEHSNYPYGEGASVTVKEVYERIQTLPPTQRIQAEIVHLVVIHEVYDAYSDINPRLFFRDDSLLNLLPENIRDSSASAIRAYLREAESLYRSFFSRDIQDF